jgi:hypothetical protein
VAPLARITRHFRESPNLIAAPLFEQCVVDI